MSFRTKLTIGSKEYPVKHFTMLSHRSINAKGRPASSPEWILLVYLDTIENDSTLLDWMIDPHKEQDGDLKIYKTDEDSKLKTIQFKKAYCYFLSEEFDNDIGYLATLLKIGGNEIHVGSSHLSKEWS